MVKPETPSRCTKSFMQEKGRTLFFFADVWLKMFVSLEMLCGSMLGCTDGTQGVLRADTYY